MSNSNSVKDSCTTGKGDAGKDGVTQAAGSAALEMLPCSAGVSRGRPHRATLTFCLVALSVVFARGCDEKKRWSPPPIQLLELSNRPLVPATSASSAGQTETSSLVIPEGDACPNGCVFVGYGNGWGASLMRGELSCLGEPGCMQPIALAMDAPGGVVTGVGETINADGTKQPSLGGKLVNGVCQGGTPSSQNIYLNGVGTDNVLARASDGSLLYIRAAFMLFPDPAADCVLDLRLGTGESNSFRQVNIVSRSTGDGKIWGSSLTQVLTGTAPGDPQTHSSLDRFDLYANPFDKTLYVSGGSGTGKSGVNTSLLFASTDNGQTWVKRGSPLNNSYGAYAPLVLAATENRLFAAVCADTQYPPVKQHPVLGWSEDGGKTWTTSEGGPLSNYQCGAKVPPANLAGSGFINLAPDISIAPIQATSKADFVRMVFTSFVDDSNDLADRQKLVVLNLTVTPDGNVAVSPVIDIEAPNSGSIVRSGFVSADPSLLPDEKGINTAVLWWLESDNPNFTANPRMRAKFLVSYDSDDWSKPQPLAVSSAPLGWITYSFPTAWKHTVNSWGLDYNNGSFFFRKGRLNYFINWPQDDPTNGVPRIHYNIVSVLPKDPAPPDYSNLGVIVLRKPDFPPAPNPCLSCPFMDLTFTASRPGPVEITMTADGQVMAPFQVQANAGINLIRLGDPRRALPSEGTDMRFTVELKAAGQRGQLARTIIAAPKREVAIPRTRGTRPSEPMIPVRPIVTNRQ